MSILKINKFTYVKDVKKILSKCKKNTGAVKQIINQSINEIPYVNDIMPK